MRRRIYIAPDGSGLEDVTAQPYRYGIEREHANEALYDDALWSAYVAAREMLGKLEAAVIGHLRDDPYDDVERAAAQEGEAILDDNGGPIGDRVARMEALSQQLLRHADVVHAASEAPR